MAFYTKGVRFDTLDVVLKIYRKQAKPKQEVLSFFSATENRQLIEDKYETLPSLTIAEALRLGNAEQRMLALQCFEAEELISDLKAQLLDRQVLTKKQIRWNEQLHPYEHVYEDTYELYKIDATALGLERQYWYEPAVYIVKCQCTSTNRTYCLYVSDEIAKHCDAVAAIAWTMRFNGNPLSKYQYLNFMYSES
jgi:hypothetical protein